MVTSSLSSSDQCKQDLLIFNQLERLEAEQPEEAWEGRGLVRGGQQRGEVSTVQYSTVQYSTVQRRGEVRSQESRILEFLNLDNDTFEMTLLL